MRDPTEGMVRAYEIMRGDAIECVIDEWPKLMVVNRIQPLGGDEMGCAVWRFISSSGKFVEFPYAALVKRAMKSVRAG